MRAVQNAGTRGCRTLADAFSPRDAAASRHAASLSRRRRYHHRARPPRAPRGVPLLVEKGPLAMGAPRVGEVAGAAM